MVNIGYIYKIKIGDKFYFGQTINKSERKAAHKYHLRKNKHVNKYMQNAYNKTKDFSFSVMFSCPASKLNELEQFYISKYKEDSNCINLNKDVRMVASEYKMTESHRQKIKKVHTGKTVSDFTKKLMSESAKKRIERDGWKMHYNKSGGNNPKARIVVNTENGFFYETVQEAAYTYGYKRSTLNSKLCGNSVNNTLLLKV